MHGGSVDALGLEQSYLTEPGLCSNGPIFT